TPLFDYFVIGTGNSRRQMHAIAGEVRKVLKRYGSKRLGLEGLDSSKWIVQDFGDVVVHLFTEEARGLYDLEHLWGDALRVDWTELADQLDDESAA
ncbi:MAG: ribosome silencing factor, partial [Planctomycetaceae bacterium]|nr:ribosome silencing factor [Planctomycetaceae bacterium]